MTRPDRLLLLGLAGTLAITSSCTISKKNVIFATKTSWGVDVDSKPPTLDVGFARQEGSFAPVTQADPPTTPPNVDHPDSGRVLPLWASVSGRGSFLGSTLGLGVNQSFAIGNAALLMSRYLGSLDHLADAADDKLADRIFAKGENPSSIAGSLDESRVYFFGTNTSLGLKVGLGAGLTDGNIGYKRDELAVIPITEEGGKLHLPSMIATVTASAEGSGEGGGVSTAQFYATGLAATYLAAEPAIRSTIGRDIIGDADANAELQKASQEADYWRLRGTESQGKVDKAIDALSDEQLEVARYAAMSLLTSPDAAALQEDPWTTADKAKKRTYLKKYTAVSDEAEVLKLEAFALAIGLTLDK